MNSTASENASPSLQAVWAKTIEAVDWSQLLSESDGERRRRAVGHRLQQFTALCTGVIANSLHQHFSSGLRPGIIRPPVCRQRCQHQRRWSVDATAWQRSVAVAVMRPFDTGRYMSACGPLLPGRRAPAKLSLAILVAGRHSRRRQQRSYTRAAGQ